MPTPPSVSHRPVIGITSYVAEARWGFWEMPAALVPLGYVNAVVTAGGRPVVLPPVLEGIDETLAAVDGDVPVLGVCRGMQLINVAYGGTLIQHLPDVVGHDGHRTEPGHFDVHAVRLADGSRVAEILGDRVEVCSGHHQGIATAGAGLTTVACAEDGSVEAVEDRARRFLVGVLWHPEEGDDRRLFTALVGAAG